MLAGTSAKVVEQIRKSDLPCPVYRTCRELLDIVDDATGIILLSETDFKVICQSEAEGTIRSHLIQMQAAGILRYSRRLPRNGAVQQATIFIQFEAWANPILPLEPMDDEKMIAGRSNLIAQRSFSESAGDAETEVVKKMIDQRSFSRAQRSNLIAERSFSGSTSHARLGRLGRSLTTTEKRKDLPTYPTPPRTQAQQLAFELLTDGEVGVIHRVADDLARKLPLPEIYRAVDRWLPERERDVGTGALVTRLRELKPTAGDPPGAVRLSAGFRDSELFHRHRLPDEMVADPERKQYSYVPESQQGRRYSV